MLTFPDVRAPVRVAVADDDPQVRSALAGVVRSHASLELAGTAEDGRQAVDLVARWRPDVVLMDVRMPHVDGAEATRRIRARGLPTRVVALSAHDDRKTLLAMLQAGAVGYLVKGCPVAEIVRAAEHAAQGLSALSGQVSTELIHEMTFRLGQDEQAARRRSEIVRRVQAALDGALDTVLQPIIDLSSGAAVGVEALTRFPADPARTPDRCFAEAAEVGLRTELELAALHAALALRRRLPAGLYLAVNAGPDTVLSPQFTALGADGLLDGVVLEITEHAPVDDYVALARVLTPLRAAGLRVAIDDAGAGFASLRHILRLDPDLIKLDMALTQGMHRDRAKHALATALISFANEIGAAVVAEGIEEAAEVEALRALGVRYGQGFHLRRPAPPTVCLSGLGQGACLVG